MKNVVLPVLRKKKLRIPHDLELITFDEIPDDVSEKDTIHEIVQPFYEMAKMSIEKMEKIIDNQYPAVRIILQPELLIKEDRKNFLITAEQQKGGE